MASTRPALLQKWNVHAGLVPSPMVGPMALAERGCFGKPVHCSRNQTLVGNDASPDHIYAVISGAFRVCHLWPDGRRQILRFLIPGNYYGWVDSVTHSRYVEAVVDSNVQEYQRSTIDALLASEPLLGRQLVQVITDELSEAQEQICCLGRMNAAERLAGFLLHMAYCQGRYKQPGHGHVLLPMDRRDIADHLGLRIETVSRVLAQLAARRIIARPTIRAVIVLQPDILEMLALGATQKIVTSDKARVKAKGWRMPQLQRHIGNA